MEKVKCHFCPTMVDKEDAYCHGCNIHICEECDIGESYGKHKPEDHLVENDDDE